MPLFHFLTEKQVRTDSTGDGAVSETPSIQDVIKEEDVAIEAVAEAPTRYVPLSEDLTEPFGESSNDCRHAKEATVTTLDGAKCVFQSITNAYGDSIHAVCADCHLRPERFVGVVKKHRPLQPSTVLMDLLNPSHIAQMLTCPCAPYFKTDEGFVEVPYNGFDSIAGLARGGANNEKSITVQGQRRKKYRRRDGLIGQLLLEQDAVRLTEEEQDSVRRALNLSKRRKFN